MMDERQDELIREMTALPTSEVEEWFAALSTEDKELTTAVTEKAISKLVDVWDNLFKKLSQDVRELWSIWSDEEVNGDGE